MSPARRSTYHPPLPASYPLLLWPPFLSLSSPWVTVGVDRGRGGGDVTGDEIKRGEDEKRGEKRERERERREEARGGGRGQVKM